MDRKSTDWKATAKVWGFGLWKVPVIAFVAPRVRSVADATCEIEIPLTWRTKNHLGSMYFGVLCVGADLAGGYLAMSRIWERSKAQGESGESIALVFKSVEARFLKRPDRDVVFHCEDGKKLDELVALAASSGERHEAPVRVEARVASAEAPGGYEVVAEFQLVISLKRKQKKQRL